MAEKTKLDRKLAAYSAAAAAALAMAPAADAAIIYSGIQNLPVNSNIPVNIDMDGIGGTDFIFTGGTGFNYPFVYFVNYITGTNGGNFVDTFTSGNAANLPSGYTVGPAIASWGLIGTLNETHLYFSTPTFTRGNFVDSTGYIGVRFTTICPPSGAQGTAYGWIQYTGSLINGNVIDWAYEDTCVPIQTGAGAVNAVPTMGEWGMLALAGLLSAISIKAINREEETA